MMFYPSNAAFPGLQTAFQESPSFFLELSAKFFDSFRLSDKVVKKSSYNIRKNNNYDPDKACISFIRFLSQAVNKGPGPEDKRQKKYKSEYNENKGITWHFTVSCFGFYYSGVFIIPEFLLFRSFYYSGVFIIRSFSTIFYFQYTALFT